MHSRLLKKHRLACKLGLTHNACVIPGMDYRPRYVEHLMSRSGGFQNATEKPNGVKRDEEVPPKVGATTELEQSYFRRSPLPRTRNWEKRKGNLSDPRNEYAQDNEYTPAAGAQTQSSLQTFTNETSGNSDNNEHSLLLQPYARPITQGQLATEVKSIYKSLIMVENKCIHVDRTQAAAIRKAQAENHPIYLFNEQWQALTALHRTLLHEHHDLLLALHHPCASKELRQLAVVYKVPARMWHYGIYSYLELLRHQLPESLEHMLHFVYLAFQLIARLFEAAPSLEDTWAVHLGHLGRYRMAIEDENPRDRETWAGVARFWYRKPTIKFPTAGGLYHHLAIISRPNTLQQMYLYSRSLNSVEPFHTSRESVMTELLEPVLGCSPPAFPQPPEVDISFLRLQKILLERTPRDKNEWVKEWKRSSRRYRGQLIKHVGERTVKFRMRGAYTAITIITGICEFGWNGSFLRCLYECHGKRRDEREWVTKLTKKEQDASGDTQQLTLRDLEARLIKISTEIQPWEYSFVRERAVDLALSTFKLMLEQADNEGVKPFVYIFLAFLVSINKIDHKYVKFVQGYAASLFPRVAWKELCAFVNRLIDKSKLIDLNKIRSTGFLQERVEGDDILPEDEMIRGQIFAETLFLNVWFHGVSDDAPPVEPRSTLALRSERIVHATHELALSVYVRSIVIRVESAGLMSPKGVGFYQFRRREGKVLPCSIDTGKQHAIRVRQSTRLSLQIFLLKKVLRSPNSSSAIFTKCLRPYSIS